MDRARRSERLLTYERVLGVSRDHVFAVDGDGHFTFVSPALADRLDYDPTVLVGEHRTTVLVDAGVREVADTTRQSDTGSEPPQTDTVGRPDGR
jgi:PAS domain-containing protein